DRKASGIAHRRGTEEGQHQKWARIHAPSTQSLTKVLILLRQIKAGGHINQPPQPEGAVKQKASGRDQGTLAFSLQDVIDQVAGFTEVREEVRYRPFTKIRHHRTICLSHRLEGIAVNSFVKREDCPVITLPRILWVASCRLSVVLIISHRLLDNGYGLLGEG